MDDYGRASGSFLGWAFTQSPFPEAIHDQDLVCLGINDRMCQMFGFTQDELRGRRLTDVLHGPQYDAMERYMRQVLDTGKPASRETYRRTRVARFRLPGQGRGWPHASGLDRGARHHRAVLGAPAADAAE
jgi:PAS domain S-box-containing protein